MVDWAGLPGASWDFTTQSLGNTVDTINQLPFMNIQAPNQDFSPLQAGKSSQNTDYVVRLYELNASNGGGLSVVANAPRSFNFALENIWLDVLSVIRDLAGGEGLGGTAVSVVKGVQSITGTNFLPQSVTLQVWQGAPPFAIEVPMIFNAIDNTYEDVVKPIQQLVKMASPKRSGAFLQAPGPAFADVVKNGGDMNKIEHLLALRIGRSVNLPGLIISSLRVEWDDRFDEKGLPIAAEANVGLKTYWTMAQDEIARAFLGGS